MKIGFEVFLVVAREMSITKAANELHITQQCASDHIKRLEKEYNVVLFERRPKFRLTQAGEIMLHNLLNIQIMETSMSRSLAGIAEGTVVLPWESVHPARRSYCPVCCRDITSVTRR